MAEFREQNKYIQEQVFHSFQVYAKLGEYGGPLGCDAYKSSFHFFSLHAWLQLLGFVQSTLILLYRTCV